MNNYEAFLDSKRASTPAVGFECDDLSSQLFDFQRDIARWALRRGRAAVFADCGLGKTPIQLEWAKHVAEETSKPAIIFAPLAVAQQTHREGKKFHIPVKVCRSQNDIAPGVNVTNYEMLEHFQPDDFGGIVLDESSILKSYSGVYRNALTEFAFTIGFRLACTATPAPNDLIEVINHAEFLGIMEGKEIIALYFTQDGNTTHKWRLKGHAHTAFWSWLAQWAVALRSPADLGYSDDGFILPPLSIHHEVVDSPESSVHLFPVEAHGLQDRLTARRDSLPARVSKCAELANASDEPWLLWCNLNAESEALAKAIPGAVQIRGSDSNEHKTKTILDFIEGRLRVVVSKPSIIGFGMNLQHCHNVAFVGLSDSWEQYYQAVRRCWRFGQESEVDVHVVTAEAEGAVVENIDRKEQQAKEMFAQLIKHMEGLQLDKQDRHEMTYEEETKTGKDWTMMLGDAVARLNDVESDSVGLSVFSPPFPGMYAYTNSMHDMGNVQNMQQMIDQYGFLLPHLLRVLMPGRSVCVHLTQGVAFKGVDGYIGLKDFRGEVIRAHENAGFIYYGEVCIDKDPQVKAIRTKDAGLLFKSLASDSSRMHMALADYMLQFRKPGDNTEPIRAGTSERYDNAGWITSDEWIEWAAPVWYRQTKDYPGGIRETDVLNVRAAREAEDERHLCPLQLGVIERAVKLWSAPGDLVLSPFAGVGSEGYEALRLGRRFVGIELKRSYFEQACRNLAAALKARDQDTLLDLIEE